MWFITEFIERTTFSVARTVFATLEAEAQRRVMGEARAQRALARGGLVLPARSLCVPPSIALQSRGILLGEDAPEPAFALQSLVQAADATAADAGLIVAVKPGDVLDAIVAAETGPMPAAQTEPAPAADLPGLPLGVRGDVIARYVGAFATAAAGDRAALIERLRKDKKVRVAELQLIAAAVLGGDVVWRKKADHLETLRRATVPAERRRAVSPAERGGVYAG